jgi:hypothetical protein
MVVFVLVSLSRLNIGRKDTTAFDERQEKILLSNLWVIKKARELTLVLEWHKMKVQ